MRVRAILKVTVLSFGLVVFVGRGVSLEAKIDSAQPSEISRAQEEVMRKAFGNFLAIETGELKDGEQIPLPAYQDGTAAKRNECRYFVSPAEIPTSLTYISNQVSGAFYVKCSVDKNGFVHVSLWQQSGSGEGVKVIGADSYEQIKKQFSVPGVTSPSGEENVVTQQMKILSERILVNYLVIAIRSSSEKVKPVPQKSIAEQGEPRRGIIS